MMKVQLRQFYLHLQLIERNSELLIRQQHTQLKKIVFSTLKITIGSLDGKKKHEFKI